MVRKAFIRLLIPFLLFYALPVSAAEKEEHPWQEEIVYYIVVDRFNNGNPHNDGKDRNPQDPAAYHGGDLEGVIKKLDYLKEMGFTAIALSSVMASEDYTGNLVENHKQVEEHFGSMADLQRLVEEAHKREMKVILEFVANHVGPNHPWIEEKQQWFHQKVDLTDVQDQENRLNGWVNGLPDLATENEETRDFLIETAAWWLEETNADGFYINHPDTIETEFWQLFQSEIKKVNNNAYLIGSLLDSSNESKYLESGFDSILNERFFQEASDMFAKVDLPFAAMTDVVENSSPALITYLDSDNDVRFTRKSVENNQHPGIRLKMALSYMYTIPGTPFVYYGTEIALNGGEPPENRPLMNFQSDEELIDYIGKLAKIRNSLPALTKGDYHVLYEKDGMIIFTRTLEDETVIVAINNTSASQKVVIPEADIAENKELQGLLTGDTFEEENGEYEFILDREIAEIYEVNEKKGLNLPFISVFIFVPVLFIVFLVLAKKRGKRKE
ncbi:alpha-amylase family glycosyl hydrolase [uncultured Metabacillus sp.]|uniref:alpha-amylase family glycosyl hydrolase n=1 Tax=uncultured Metabacillus sp. TaxID=2860135 RepID=UPI00261B8389|nr:alpha-amylase family glycosyl hydrolase [uncultured Metabacillus sp.]